MRIDFDTKPRPTVFDALGEAPAPEWRHGTVTFRDGSTARISGRGSKWYAVNPDGAQGRGATATMAASNLLRELSRMAGTVILDGQTNSE